MGLNSVPASEQIGGFTETEVLCEAEIEGWRREARPDLWCWYNQF